MMTQANQGCCAPKRIMVWCSMHPLPVHSIAYSETVSRDGRVIFWHVWIDLGLPAFLSPVFLYTFLNPAHPSLSSHFFILPFRLMLLYLFPIISSSCSYPIYFFHPLFTLLTVLYSRLCHSSQPMLPSYLSHFRYFTSVSPCAGILEQSMGARNRVGIGLLYRPVRLNTKQSPYL